MFDNMVICIVLLMVDVIYDSEIELTDIKFRYKDYISNKKNVFKSCHNCIVVLQKTIDTKTNEKRKGVVNEEFASFRGDIFKVILIFDRHSPLLNFSEIKNSMYGEKVNYVVGQLVRSDFFDKDIEKICTHGIHYFKTIDPAFYTGYFFGKEWNYVTDSLIKVKIFEYEYSGSVKRVLYKNNEHLVFHTSDGSTRRISEFNNSKN